ncbi:MAG: hypothetical protein LC687_05220 [Actinobacteria bacterium]|nr:hypothetical protein [Actinomycetota bacterium]
MRKPLRALAVLASAAALSISLATPSSATDYGRPSGKWFEAIVSHEVGHCLGWYNRHKPYGDPSIMRSSLHPLKLASGQQGYKPTLADIREMGYSRQNSVEGERATYWVQYPFTNDGIPVYNMTGRDSAFWAANRWGANNPLSFWRTSSDPRNGITIRWGWELAGTSVGGRADVTKMHNNGSFAQISDCVVLVNPRVVT